MFRIHKKAQITIFIIIGVIILFSSGLIFYLKSSQIQDKMDYQIKSSASKVPLDFLPVKEFTDNCLRRIGIDALNYIGQHGGYYNLSAFRNDLRSINSEVVKNRYEYLPYWYYIKNCDKSLGCGASIMPGLSRSDSDRSIQEELENYVDDHIQKCILNYTTFDKRYDIKILSKPKTSVIIRKKDVYFKLNMPIDVKEVSKKNSIKADTFVQSVRINFEKIYKFSNDLITAESKTGFMEKSVFDAMSFYMGVDNILPPMDAVDSNSPKIWLYNDIKEVLDKQIIPTFVPLFHVVGTLSYKSINENYYQNDLINKMNHGFVQSFNKRISEDPDYSGLLVNFDYIPGKLFLGLNNGQYIVQPVDLMSMQSGGLLKMIFSAINIYKTSYDFTFPISVEIIDTSADPVAFPNGYVFKFGMEMNLRRNEPYTDSVNLKKFSVRNTFDLTDLPQLYPNRTFKIRAFDFYSKESIPDADVVYDCGKSYFLGKTNSSGILETRLPSCLSGGRIYIRKEGYSGYTKSLLNTPNTKDLNVEVGSWPIKNVNFTVTVVRFNEFVTKPTKLDIIFGKLFKLLSITDSKNKYISEFIKERTTAGDNMSAIYDKLHSDDFKSYLSSKISDPDEIEEVLSKVGSYGGKYPVSLNYELNSLHLFNGLYTLTKVGSSFVFPIGTLISFTLSAIEELSRKQGFDIPISDKWYLDQIVKGSSYRSVISKNRLDANYSSIVSFEQVVPSTRPIPLLSVVNLNHSVDKETIGLIPGIYNISGTLFYNGNFTMNVMSFCDQFGFMEDLCNSALGLDTKPIKVSGYVPGGTNLVLIVKPEDLYNKNTLNLWIIDKGLPRTTKDFKDEGFDSRVNKAIPQKIFWE